MQLADWIFVSRAVEQVNAANALFTALVFLHECFAMIPVFFMLMCYFKHTNRKKKNLWSFVIVVLSAVFYTSKKTSASGLNQYRQAARRNANVEFFLFVTGHTTGISFLI